ncbi:2OG-Fe(II) oxygenase [Massilia sp. W12]|uniref:2OG-Fe(II) oxygenase n=1 Tax=Massilia sp. W12 TaxID=3126507 RepID=UPI0030D56FE2
MPDMLNLLKVFPSMLSARECETLIAAYETQAALAESENSQDANSGKYRQAGFSAVSLQPEHAAFALVHQRTGQAIDAWLNSLQQEGRYNIHLLRQHLRYAHDYRILKYPTGSSIHPHTDWDVFTLGSCTLALNDEYEGGEFSFFNGAHNIRLKRGDIMIWPADCFWVHEVKPIQSGVRYSVNSFINAIPEPLKLKTIAQLNALPASDWRTAWRHRLSPQAASA